MFQLSSAPTLTFCNFDILWQLLVGNFLYQLPEQSPMCQTIYQVAKVLEWRHNFTPTAPLDVVFSCSCWLFGLFMVLCDYILSVLRSNTRQAVELPVRSNTFVQYRFKPNFLVKYNVFIHV